MARLVVAASLAFGLLVNCGSELPRPRLGPHKSWSGTPAVVEFPPPPARVERVPPQPRPACVWIDGQWQWSGRHWEWLAGAWVKPPEGCYYAEPLTVWVPSAGKGELFFMPGRWYADAEGAPCASPICGDN